MAVGVLGDHTGHERADAVDHPPDVHTEHPRPVLDRALPRHPALEHTSVEAQDVDLAELAEGPIGERLDRRGVGDVGGDRQSLAPGVGDERRGLGRRVGIDVGGDDPHALGGEALDQAAPDPAARAGDDRDPPVELVDHWLASLFSR